jgi:hypothetical protein
MCAAQSRAGSALCVQVNSQPDLGATSKNGGSVYPAEHEAKARTIAAVLTVAMQNTLERRSGVTGGMCRARDGEKVQDGLDQLREIKDMARELGLERVEFEEDVGREWWETQMR